MEKKFVLVRFNHDTCLFQVSAKTLEEAVDRVKKLHQKCRPLYVGETKPQLPANRVVNLV